MGGKPSGRADKCDAMKTISLTKGKVAIVDDADFASQSKWFWRASVRRNGRIYAIRRKGKTAVYLHREIMAAPKGLVVDHANGNGLDNRRTNLRLASPRQNSANSTARLRTAEIYSLYKGVSWSAHSKQWQAKIHAAGKDIILGKFSNEEAAARAYDAKAIELHGDFARTNFGPQSWTNLCPLGRVQVIVH